MNNKYVVSKLLWDSSFFNLKVSSIYLNENIDETDWLMIDKVVQNDDLIYIKNLTKNRYNSKIISYKTNAFIVDTNIVFEKKCAQDNYIIDFDFQDLKYFFTDEPVYDLSLLLDFSDSRFVVDEKLLKLGGSKVHIQWVINSYKNKDKKFLYVVDKNYPIGFLLFSISNTIATIELISVISQYQGKKIGSLLIHLLEEYLYNEGIQFIKVGTQVSNFVALNFYIKSGFKITDTIDVYHWWKK